jgi:hypothetical protein
VRKKLTPTRQRAQEARAALRAAMEPTSTRDVVRQAGIERAHRDLASEKSQDEVIRGLKDMFDIASRCPE